MTRKEQNNILDPKIKSNINQYKVDRLNVEISAFSSKVFSVDALAGGVNIRPNDNRADDGFDNDGFDDNDSFNDGSDDDGLDDDGSDDDGSDDDGSDDIKNIKKNMLIYCLNIFN